MKIYEIYNLYKENYLVDTDTRRIRKGSIFFALKGDNYNGNEFALKALEKGASYAIVDEGSFNNQKVIKVNNTLNTLQKLANFHKKELNIPIISLTGSNGKTTSKELINAVLSKKYVTTATVGNLNNHIGVPLTLLSMNKKTEIGIVEMGANHHKEIALLSNISSPDYGYITNFGKAHLEGFGSLEGVITAKSELYDYLLENNKKVFVNPDDVVQMDRTVNHDRIVFHKDIQFKEMNPYVSLLFKNKAINSKLIGSYNYNNIAAAISIGNYFGVDDEAIIKAIEHYIPSNNRSQIINTATNKIILDAYNANPTSMKFAIQSFNELTKTNKILILGDMFELGEDSLKEHQDILAITKEFGFNNVLIVGSHFYKTETDYLKFEDLKSVINYLSKQNFTNTTFLIKGSRGMALEKLVEYIN